MAATCERTERTLLMIKPDGVQRGFVGKIIQRFEDKGFKLVAMKYMLATEEHLKVHYADHADRAFFPGLVKYMLSGPVVPMVWEGLPGIVKTARIMLGATHPAQTYPGTIRGDYCLQTGRLADEMPELNIMHASDSVKAAKMEIGLWFSDEEIVKWQQVSSPWIRENTAK